jgi:hypothetical protein
MQGSAGNGPGWFSVRTRDGRTLQYGNSLDSRILTVGSTTARVWALSSVRDRAGNRIEHEYVNDANNIATAHEIRSIGACSQETVLRPSLMTSSSGLP